MEFAVILPVLLLIIMGILFFGRYENYSNQITQMAEQGARSAAVASSSTTSASLVAAIKAQAPPEISSSSTSTDFGASQVYIYYPTTQPSATVPVWSTVGDSIRVCVVATVTFPVLFGITTVNPVIAQNATMRIEAAPTASLATSGTPPSQCPTT